MKQIKEILVTDRIGLVPYPSLNAGTLATHGTGGELDCNYSYKLNKAEIARNKDLFPNITFLNESGSGDTFVVDVDEATTGIHFKKTSHSNELSECLGGNT